MPDATLTRPAAKGAPPALVAAIAADPHPAVALRREMEQLGRNGGAAEAAELFESVHYRLPPFADDRLPLVAAELYHRLGRADAALLLAGLAVQLQPAAPATLGAHRILHACFGRAGRAAEAEAVAARVARLFPGTEMPPVPLGPASPGAAALAPEIERIGGAQDPGTLLLGALERLGAARDWAASALLFEGVWHRVPPLLGYWIYFRMTRVYAELHRAEAALLLATLTVQIEPATAASREPWQRLFEAFRSAGRLRDAAELALRQHMLAPDHKLLAEPELAALLAAAGPLAAPPAPRARQDRTIIPPETRAPHRWPAYGGGVPAGLAQPLEEMPRDPVSIAEVADVEVLVGADSVAVIAADGMPYPDLSVGEPAALLRRRIEERRAAGHPVEERTIEAALLAIDEFPPPNLCHFLLDHASRLLLYRRAGVDLGRVTVIGPEPRREYQRLTLARLGVGAWIATGAPARLSVRRLLVSSNCRHVRHPGHWGAAWAVGGMRALFDLAPRPQRRRLLISRRDVTYRRLGNEADVQELLHPLGFETIVPGAHSFAEQVAAFRDASHVIGPHGQALANIVFCGPGTHVLEVFHPCYGTWAYAMLGAALGITYASMVGRDALSEAPEFNDPDWPQERRNIHAGRDMRADLGELRRWLAETGAS
jgi:hypothetical protein